MMHVHMWKKIKDIPNYRLESAGVVGHYKKFKCRFCKAMRVRMTGIWG